MEAPPSASPARRWSSRRREGQERRLGDVLGEGMLEDVHGVVAGRALEDALLARQVAEVRLDRPGAVPERREEARGEFPAKDGGGLEGALRLLGEPVDARGEDPVHGVRDGQVRAEALVAHGPGQLLEEKRIALRLVEDHAGQRLGVRCRQEGRTTARLSSTVSRPSDSWLANDRSLHGGR